MKLVDADKLPIKYDGHTVSVWKCDLDAAPAVDAIPKEWIKKQLKEEPYRRLLIDHVEWHNCLGWLIDEWEKENENDMYIPKKSPNFTFNIFDSDSGKIIARDIPLSDKNAKEIFDNYERIKADWEKENETNAEC